MKKGFMLAALCAGLAAHPLGSAARPGPAAGGEQPAMQARPKGCEQNNILLEQSHEAAGEDSLIILVGRPGKRDKRVSVTGRRLYTARAYLTSYLKLRGLETVVTAEAPNRGMEYGTVEIYVKGRMFAVLPSFPDKGLGLGSCDSPESDDKESRARRALLYPWLYKRPPAERNN